MADLFDASLVDDHSHIQHIKDNSGEVTLSGNDEQMVGTNAAASSDNLDEIFGCPHCDKSYNTNKSLARHLKSSGSECWKRRRSLEGGAWEEQTKLKCSRCSKRVATKATLDRHTRVSCWKICDECAANGAPQCDALSKDGPCRTCDAHGRSCVKHSGPGDLSQEPSTSGELSAAVRKRKASAKVTTSLAEGHKDKRAATDDQSVAGSDTVQSLDSFEFRAHVPPQVEFPNNPVAAISVPHEQAQNPPVQATHAHTQNELPFHSHSQVSDQGHPAPASILPSQHIDGTSTLSHSLHGPFAPSLPNLQTTRSGVPASRLPLVSELPPIAPFGELPKFSPTLMAQVHQMNHAEASGMPYRNAIEAHPWYQAVVQENNRIKNVLASQQHLIMFRDAQIEALKAELHDAQELSRQVTELPAVKKAMEKAQADAREQLNPDAAASDHAGSQHAPPVSRPRSATVMAPSAFIAKCEAARDDEHVSSLLGEPAMQFPALTSQNPFSGDAGQFTLDDTSLFQDFGQFGDPAEEQFGDPAAEEEFGSQKVGITDEEQE